MFFLFYGFAPVLQWLRRHHQRDFKPKQTHQSSSERQDRLSESAAGVLSQINNQPLSIVYCDDKYSFNDYMKNSLIVTIITLHYNENSITKCSYFNHIFK